MIRKTDELVVINFAQGRFNGNRVMQRWRLIGHHFRLFEWVYVTDDALLRMRQVGDVAIIGKQTGYGRLRVAGIVGQNKVFL